MENKELLRKRVIVTNYYPNCPFEVGEILYIVDENRGEAEPYYYNWERGDRSILVIEVEKSTACFREMGWFENRTKEDLPAYVRTYDMRYFKVDWQKSHDGQPQYWTICFEDNIGGRYFTSQLLPATQKEYENYLQSKTK